MISVSDHDAVGAHSIEVKIWMILNINAEPAYVKVLPRSCLHLLIYQLLCLSNDTIELFRLRTVCDEGDHSVTMLLQRLFSLKEVP